MFLRKLLQLLENSIAPVLFAVHRVSKSQCALKASLSCDPTYLRALEAQVIKNNSSLLDFQQLAIASQFIAYLRPEAAKSVRQLVALSQSALLQDLLAVLVNNEKRNGYFVEVGVGSGIHISNTFMLEVHFGWSGLLIEPNRAFHQSIRESRSAKLIEKAAYSKSGLNLNFEATDVGEYSGLSDTMPKKRTAAARKITKEYVVETATLNEILSESLAPNQIDYMSIDTEGSEYDILCGLDLERWKVQLFSVELNGETKKTNKIDRHLIKNGYTRILANISQYDGYYLKNSLASQFSLN